MHNKLKGDEEIPVFKISTIELGDNSESTVLACQEEDLSSIPWTHAMHDGMHL